jgi:hypothetical protein
MAMEEPISTRNVNGPQILMRSERLVMGLLKGSDLRVTLPSLLSTKTLISANVKMAGLEVSLSKSDRNAPLMTAIREMIVYVKFAATILMYA